jgi:hypothetical protein
VRAAWPALMGMKGSRMTARVWVNGEHRESPCFAVDKPIRKDSVRRPAAGAITHMGIVLHTGWHSIEEARSCGAHRGDFARKQLLAICTT